MPSAIPGRARLLAALLFTALILSGCNLAAQDVPPPDSATPSDATPLEPAPQAEPPAPPDPTIDAALPDPPPDPPPPNSPPPEPEPAPTPGAVTALADAPAAVVRIVAQGSFRHPDLGEFHDAPGSGSGFIIDPAGLAVTNNHVVTGADTLRVYAAGDTAHPLTAHVVAVSECSDLAVIQIEGDDHPFLDWYRGEVGTGGQAFAAGYPLGVPELTVTTGTVRNNSVHLDTEWASIDAALEHDALLQPGSSGGPLLDHRARVIGINYAAGVFASGLNQNFSIRTDEALSILDQLLAGHDVESIGVNGRAIVVEDFPNVGIRGIWVASVAPGSPAHRVGLLPGDIITHLQGQRLGDDRTLAAYCDVLRAHGTDAALTIAVYRRDTGQLLRGSLNTPVVLQPTGLFVDTLSDLPPGPPSTPYAQYLTTTDATGWLSVEVPAEWGAALDSTTPWIVDGESVGPALTATRDLQAFADDWLEAGLFFGVSPVLVTQHDPATLLDYVLTQVDVSSCVFEGRTPYDDGIYVGLADLFIDCGGRGVDFISIAALPSPGAFIVSVQVKAVTDADLEALERIITTFFVAPPDF